MKSTSSRSAKQPAAKRSSSSVQSKTDWARLRAGAVGTATPEHPEAALRHTVRGIVRRGLTPQPAKAAISLRIEQDVLEWFKAQGPGYQTRMTAVLRAFRDASV
ncbi:MAG: BrnA antitoxin family protein [Dokdonella sp.]